MKRALAIGVLLGLAAAAWAGTRPATIFQQQQQLYGNPTRWVMQDAGQSGLFATTGVACVALAGVKAQTLMLLPEYPTNICLAGGAYEVGINGGAFDGGCSVLDTDVHFGVPVPAWTPQFVSPDPTATYICAASDAGTVRVPIFGMQ